MAQVFSTAGKEYVIDKLDESVQTLPNKIGWGTGAGTSAVGDTTLFTEDSGGSPTYARATATLSQPSATVLRAVGTLTANANKNITNAGLFDAASGGVLFAKGDFSSVPVETNDAIELTVNYTQG